MTRGTTTKSSTPRGRGNKQGGAVGEVRRSSRNVPDNDETHPHHPPQSYQQHGHPPPPASSGEFTPVPILEMNNLFEHVSKISRDLAILKDENAELRGELMLIKSAFNSQAKKVAELELELDDLQQYGRRENVCFSNLKIDDKPVIEQVISLCDEINVTVTENDFVDVHPLPSTRGHAKRVIARFKDRKLGQQVMGARKSAKNIGDNKRKLLAADPTRGFGIQPNITPKRAALLKQAKAAVEKGRLNGAWVDIKTGAILIRVKSGERPRVMRNTCDILKIVPDLRPDEILLCVDESKLFDIYDTSNSNNYNDTS